MLGLESRRPAETKKLSRKLLILRYRKNPADRTGPIRLCKSYANLDP